MVIVVDENRDEVESVNDSIGVSLGMREADRAIYIDFEGRQHEPPVLLGVLYAEGRGEVAQDRLVLRHDIIDPEFSCLAGALPVAAVNVKRYDTQARSLGAALGDLVGRAEAQDRLIVSWSRHELEALEEAVVTSDLVERFALRFRDGKATAKRWLREHHPEVHFESDARKRRHTLSRYMELVGYEVPDPFGPDTVSLNIKTVRQALGRHSDWEDLSERQKKAWWMIVGHNIHDCHGLRAVVRRAVHDGASARD